MRVREVRAGASLTETPRVFVRGGTVTLLVKAERAKLLPGNVAELTLSTRDAEVLWRAIRDALTRRPIEVLRVEDNSVLLAFNEGRYRKTASIPFEVLRAHASVLREWEGRRIGKPLYAERVVEELRGVKHLRSDIAEVVQRPFNWKGLIGNRHAYYVIYYVPLLILRAGGFVEEKHYYLEVHEAPASVKHVLLALARSEL
ncbi:MAG: hypothetical protein QW324_05125 [Thermofilaceae archaeon]